MPFIQSTSPYLVFFSNLSQPTSLPKRPPPRQPWAHMEESKGEGRRGVGADVTPYRKREEEKRRKPTREAVTSAERRRATKERKKAGWEIPVRRQEKFWHNSRPVYSSHSTKKSYSLWLQLLFFCPLALYRDLSGKGTKDKGGAFQDVRTVGPGSYNFSGLAVGATLVCFLTRFPLFYNFLHSEKKKKSRVFKQRRHE